jgi:hypothetical protein
MNEVPTIASCQDYPAEWGEEGRNLAAYVAGTAGYYARACAATDPSDKVMLAEILIGRIREIRRRGWLDRADKYLDVSGSTFEVRRMWVWAVDVYEAARRRFSAGGDE